MTKIRFFSFLILCVTLAIYIAFTQDNRFFPTPFDPTPLYSPKPKDLTIISVAFGQNSLFKISKDVRLRSELLQELESIIEEIKGENFQMAQGTEGQIKVKIDHFEWYSISPNQGWYVLLDWTEPGGGARTTCTEAKPTIKEAAQCAVDNWVTNRNLPKHKP